MDAHSEPTPGAPSLRDFVRLHQGPLLALWMDRVRALPPARTLPEAALIDHLPAVLARVIALLAEPDGEDAMPPDVPGAHAIDRLSRGFDLDHVVDEYSLLRRCVLDLWMREVGDTIPLAELARLDDALDRAISHSVVEYAAARERLLRAVDRIADAAMGHSDVFDFLQQLLAVTVETGTAVETAAVLLRQGDRLYVRAATGLERDHELGFSLRIGEGFAGKIAAERRPLFLANAATSPLLQSRLLRAKGIRALYGVPLIHEDAVIGVAHIGSTVTNEFSEEDKLLFRAMANRAASVIVQSNLVERERRAHQDLQDAHDRLLETAGRERQARDDAERSQRHAEETSTMLDTLLATAPVGFAVLDTELRYQRLNPTLAELHGLPIREHLGRRVDEILPAEAASEVVPLLRQVLLTGEAVVGREISGHLSRQPTGPTHLLVSYYPVPGPDGGTTGIGVVTADISERKRIEDRLQQLVEEAHTATRLREQVMAIVSHDLKNPLAVIGMSAMVIGRVCATNPQARKQVDAIQRSVDRMDHLISDLLDMASIQQGKLVVAPVPTPVDVLIDEAIEGSAPLALEQGLRLDRDGPPLGLEVMADRARVQQVLANLIGNAIKFSPREARISVGAASHQGAAGQADEVRFWVKDTGPGIEPAELPLIFAPYWSGAARSAKKGTGLGLYITKGIVEAHGGRTWVESEPGIGSTFYFTLPRSGAVTSVGRR